MTAPRDHVGMISPAPEENRGHRHGHGWMMIACCVPMLVIAIALVAMGVASPGFLVAAIGCAVMMAVMMTAMGHGSSHGG